MEYSTVKKVINEWDPIGLFPFAPQDEYSNEIEEILEICSKSRAAEVVGEGILNVFIDAFGIEIFKFSLTECVKIANMIFDSSKDA